MPQTAQQKQIDQIITSALEPALSSTQIAEALQEIADRVAEKGMGYDQPESGSEMCRAIGLAREGLAAYDAALSRLQNLMWSQSPPHSHGEKGRVG